MAPFGPFPDDAAHYRLAVAVSGGADSLCLGLMAHAWRPHCVALIVNHGLRPDAAAEAAETRSLLTRYGMEAHILCLTGLVTSSGIQARARAARYQILIEWCRRHGILDLLVAHHRQDQAETFLMRQERRSGVCGLAGMAWARHGMDVRIIRPLLNTHPARLRATLTARRIPWIDDPSNQNDRFRRVAIRQSLSAKSMDLAVKETQILSKLRQKEESKMAALSARFIPHPFGFVRIIGKLPPPPNLAYLWRAVSGADWAPSQRLLAQLRASPKNMTLGGVWFFKRGEVRGADNWCLIREPNAASQVIKIHEDNATESIIWDGRWRLKGCAAPDTIIRRLGSAASRFKTRELPSRFIMALPSIWRKEQLIAVPHFGFCSDRAVRELRFIAWRGVPATDASVWRL